MDQFGSRLIQNKIENGQHKEKAVIFDEIINHVFTLCSDVFGNYSIQKFIEHGTHEQKTKVVEELTKHIVDLSRHNYGCKVIQKAFDVLPLNLRKIISDEVIRYDDLISLITDQNAHHAIQKIIEKGYSESLAKMKDENRIFKYKELDNVVKCLEPIIKKFYNKSYDMSMHALGCRVIQKLLECLPSK